MSHTGTTRQPELVRDPACGMQIDPAQAANTAEYNGETYYFCSDLCKKMFVLNPTHFVSVVQTGPEK